MPGAPPIAAPPLPPACADCKTILQLAQPGALPALSLTQMLRSPDGKMRIDMGAISIITDPASQKALVLDHLKQLARLVPIPQGPQIPGAPGMPQIPGLSAGLKPPQIEDLGKAFIEGHAVEGLKYIIHPPSLPGAPSIPGMPAAPKAPPIPLVAEVWTSVLTKLPVLTKVTGPFGQQVTHCVPGAAPPPPNPAQFQIPPGYKLS